MNETMTKLMKRLPIKYHKRVENIEREDGLIDECKYMLYFAEPYAWDDYTSLPVLSISEAISFIKDSTASK